MENNRLERDWHYIETYTEQVAEKVNSLSKLTLSELPTAEERVALADSIIEEYWQVTGRKPSPGILSRLANYIISEDLKDKAIDKVTNTEYPFLSEYQLKRRERKQLPMADSNLDFLEVKINKGLDSLARKTVRKSEY